MGRGSSVGKKRPHGSLSGKRTTAGKSISEKKRRGKGRKVLKGDNAANATKYNVMQIIKTPKVLRRRKGRKGFRESS